MNKEMLESKWNQFKINVKKTWTDLADEDLTREVSAQKDKLVSLVQEKYGKAKEVAEKEVNEWQTKFNHKFKGDSGSTTQETSENKES